MSEPAPPKGAMYVYDYAVPPLMPGQYRLGVDTKVSSAGLAEKTLAAERHFDVVGPRFALKPDDIASVCPPRNGRGPFAGVLPQIVLRRRTLPWERRLATDAALQPPSDGRGLAGAYPTPWLALLLLQEGENWELKPGVPLENVLPKAQYDAIGAPPNILAESLEVESGLLADILPSREELQLLCHVRQVNAEDRELSVEGSDGWFAVVVCNRLPEAGAKCRAVLVSLEGRTDLVARDPPPVASSGTVTGGVIAGEVLQNRFLERNDKRLDVKRKFLPTTQLVMEPVRLEQGILVSTAVARKRLVALASWSFECEGASDFMSLMQGLDVGLIGKTQGKGPPVTDSGHIPARVGTRAGVEQTALYRGPLVPFPLTRDPLGPYHSADQARRIAPESGLEDISYACAFEVGRLLAAADGRLAQELMRWRRGAFRQRVRLDVLRAAQQMLGAAVFPNRVEDLLGRLVLPYLAQTLVERLADKPPPLGDPFQIDLVSRAIGLQPEAFMRAFGLTSVDVARRYLSGIDTPLATEAPPVVLTSRPPVTLDEVAADVAGLERLVATRTSVIDNVRVRMNTMTSLPGLRSLAPTPSRKRKPR